MAKNKLILKTTLISVFIMLIIFLLLSMSNKNNVQNVMALESSIIRTNRGKTILLYATLVDNDGLPIPNQTIKFFDETNNIFLGENITNSEGVAILYWTIPRNYSLGIIKINATYEGSLKEFYLPSSSTYLIEIFSPLAIIYNVTDSTLDKNDHVVAPGDVVYVSFVIYDDNLNVVPNITVILYDEENNTFLKTKTDNCGKGNFTINISEDIRENVITFILKTNATENYYDDTIVTFNIYVRKIESSFSQVSVNNLICFINTVTCISGRLIDEVGNPINNAFIYLRNEFNDNLLINKTNTNGYFEFDFNISSFFTTVGEKKLVLYYNGNEKYSSAYYTLNIVVRNKIFIELNIVNETNMLVGENLSLSFTIKDLLYRPQPNVKIKISMYDSSQATIITQLTNKSGHAFCQLTILPPKGLLTIFITAHVLANGEFYDCENNNTKIVIYKYDYPEVIIERPNMDTIYAIGDKVNFKIFILYNGCSIANQEVMVFSGKDMIFSGKTDEDGYLSFNYTLDESFKRKFNFENSTKVIIYPFRIIINNNTEELIYGKEVQTRIRVNLRYRSTISVFTIEEEDEILLNISLLNVLNRSLIPFRELLIYFNETLKKYYTNELGYLVVNISREDYNYTIAVRIIFNGDSFYTAAEYFDIFEIIENKDTYNKLYNNKEDKSIPISYLIISVPVSLSIIFYFLIRKRQLTYANRSPIFEFYFIKKRISRWNICYH